MRLLLLAVIAAVAISGCVSQDTPSRQENGTPVSNVSAGQGIPYEPEVGGDANNTPPPENPGPPDSGSSESPPILLKSIGINIDAYNPATERAGDLVFTRDRLQFGVLFTEFAFVIPADMSASRQPKTSPQPTFILPMGTKVRSLVDGIVVDVPKLYSNDYSIMVASDAGSNWRYETEHVTNPLVKPGDAVKAGQVIAEVSPFNKDGNSGYGMLEIGILKGGNPPQHVCPFAYLDPSVKDDIGKKLLGFYKAWEDYRGDAKLHNETAQPVPGCLSLNPVEG